MLWDDLEGWDGGVWGRFKRKGIYIPIYIGLIHVLVQQNEHNIVKQLYSNKNIPSLFNTIKSHAKPILKYLFSVT